MEVLRGASSRLVVFRRVSWFSLSLSSAFVLSLTPVFSGLARRWQYLECRARERYNTLDRLDTDLS
jgi:hypothetical protein